MPRNPDNFVVLKKDAVEQIMAYRRIGVKALARILDKDPKEVRLWRDGERKPTWDNARKLADALGCKIEHLTGEKPFVPEGEETVHLSPGNSASGVGMPSLTATGVTILKIEQHLEQEQLLELVKTIHQIAGTGGEARIIGPGREGCMELTLQLTREQWSLIEKAFTEGKFAHLKVLKIDQFFEFDESDRAENDKSSPDADDEGICQEQPEPQTEGDSAPKLSPEQLKEILKLHAMLIEGRGKGHRADLSDTNLSDADLRSADLRSADLRRANLRRANLSGTYLKSADLSGADLSDANLSRADLSRANLNGVNLRRANLTGADLRGANLNHADLRRADLSGAELLFVHLSGADLSNANLSGANLRETDLRSANLRGVNLSGAVLTGTLLPDGFQI